MNKIEELIKTESVLINLKSIFEKPYNKIFFPLKTFGFSNERRMVNLLSLDEKTRNELINAIYDIADKRLNEIKDEISSLQTNEDN